MLRAPTIFTEENHAPKRKMYPGYDTQPSRSAAAWAESTTGSDILSPRSRHSKQHLSPDVVDRVDSPSVVQDTLRKRSLAAINMGRYANVSRFCDVPSRRRTAFYRLRWLSGEGSAWWEGCGERFK